MLRTLDTNICSDLLRRMNCAIVGAKNGATS
jgi:hypothetical protein